MADNPIAKLGIGLVLKDKGFQKSMNSAFHQCNQLTKSFKVLGGVIAGALSVKALLSFSSSCLELGSNLSEVQNVVDTVFPNMNEQANSWAKTAIKTFGMSETVAKNYMSTLGAMSQAFGYSEAQAYDQATSLTRLAGDMASFYNKTTDETFNALKAVYTGETEVLKQYGIVMSETALNEFAMSQGVGKLVKDMTEQEKVSLRLLFVQDRMAMASGDFAKTSNSWANQTRILTMQWEAFKATIGQGLINVLTPVIQWLNSIVEVAQRGAEAFANFTAGLMGIQSVLGGGSGGIAGDMASASDSAQSMASGLGSAGGSAKKLKGILAGFDKLNVLGSSSGGGGGGGASQTASLDIKPPEPTDLTNRVQNVLDSVFSGIDWSRIQSTFGELREAFTPLTRTLGDGAKWIWDNVLKPFGTWTMNEVVPRFFQTLARVLTIVNAVLQGLKPAWQWFWDNVLKPIIDWTADKFLQFWDWFNDKLDKFGKWLQENPKIIENLGIVLLSVASAILIVKGAIALLTGALTLVNGVVAGFGFVVGFLTSPIGIAIVALSALIAVVLLLAKNWDKVKETILKGWNAIKEALANVGAWFKEKFETAFNNIKEVFSSIGSWFGEKWNDIKGAFSAVGSWFSETFSEAWGNVKSAFSGVAEWASGLWDTIVERFTDIGVEIGSAIGDAFKQVVNGVLETIENTINGGIRFINSAISGINSLLGLSLGTIDTLTLPRLAQGGFVEANTPQLAVIGDNRHEGEIVAPESKITEAVTRALAGIVPAIGNAVGSAIRANMPQGGDTNVTVTLDGQVIYDTMQEYAGRANSRSGGRS